MQARMRGRRAFAVVAVIPALLLLSGCTRFGATLARPQDPVVLDGSATPKLLGAAVPRVVGFAWNGSEWQQIPVQVDERALVNPGQILHRPSANWAKKADGSDFTILAYTAPAAAAVGYSSWPTYTGTDPTATFDANDELSFLANDSGKKVSADAVAPANTVAERARRSR